MNRNVESHFSLLPQADISRSKLDISKRRLTSFNVGDLVPIYLEEVLPGDTFQVDTSKVVRLQTLITPMMDNLYLDTYYFFVPNRLVWSHWRELMGENTESAWLPTTEYSIPQIVAPSGGWNVGTIADYMGIPTGVAGLSVNALPFRAYSLICNEWFRDENLTDPLVIPVGDAQVTGVNTGNYIQDVAKGGKPFKVSKYHDYFTSALPSPQKGPDVTIPVGSVGDLPVVATENFTTEYQKKYNSSRQVPLFAHSSTASSPTDYALVSSGWSSTSASIFPTSNNPVSSGTGYVVPSNLWAIQTGNASAATINQLRLAFQVQKLYEKDARSGSRYTELIRSHFGVISPDSRLQRPEYLGGNRLPITIAQVIQQSGQVNDGTPLGDVAGMSLTTDNHSDFTKSFTEHGYIIGVCCARYDHTYQQGLRRLWSRKSRFDFYWPVFANIGEQAILNKEIYAQGKDADNGVFGYQEAWSEYRYGINEVTGEMRSAYAQSLDSWHLADYYTSQPYLSDSWIREDKAVVDRVLSVTSANSNQLFGDFYFKVYATRPMPVYSIPGLIDHH